MKCLEDFYRMAFQASHQSKKIGDLVLWYYAPAQIFIKDLPSQSLIQGTKPLKPNLTSALQAGQSFRESV